MKEMIKKLFSQSHVVWNWLVISSSNPDAVALTVKGVFSMTIVQTLFGLLPFIGIHPTFTLDVVSAGAVNLVYTFLSAVASIVTAYGLLRKIYLTLKDLIGPFIAFVAAHKAATTPKTTTTPAAPAQPPQSPGSGT